MAHIKLNEFEARIGKSDELNQFLESLIPYIRSSDGCITCEMVKHHKEPSKFSILEKWESEDAHKASIKNFPKDEFIYGLSLMSSPPKSRDWNS